MKTSANKIFAELSAADCKPLVGKGHRLKKDELATALASLPGWKGVKGTITKAYKFADFFHTMAFVNAVASVAHRQDHHPDVAFTYNTVTVAYSTHSAGGVTVNDLICAAHIDRLTMG